MLKTKSRTQLCVGVSAAALLSMPAWALAQTAPAPEPQEASQLDEIVVTAQRRNENVQDVPVTVTVMSQALIQDARIESVGDIVTRTPGLSFNAFPASEPRLSIRGVGSSSRGAGGDPSSGVFVDEIYIGRPAAIAYDTFDVQRVEVLKGPQGTLFGRNVNGGAVNIVTNRPNLTAFDASAEGSLGNYDRRDAAAFVNIPFADGTAALRIGGSLHQHDGYVKRIDRAGTVIGELEDQDSSSARVQLLVEPDDLTRFHLTFDTTTDRNKGPGNRISEITNPASGLAVRYFVDPYKRRTYATIDGQQDRDVWGGRFKAERDLPFATLSYLGSYRDVSYISFYDFDGSLKKVPGPADDRGVAGGNTETDELYSHELQLKSLPDAPFNWVVGLYNYHADTYRTLTNIQTRSATDIRREDLNQKALVDSYAVYGDVTYPVTDTINVFGGLRYTKDEKEVQTVGASTAPPIIYVGVASYNVTGSDSWGALSWRLGADWHISTDVMVYGSVSRGFKSGGFQDTPANAQDALLTFNPEFATSVELGQRGQFFDRRVTWNNSIYYTDYSDLQARIQNVVTGGFSIQTGTATIYGYETELAWTIGAGFRLTGGYAYTHARFDEFPTDAGDFSGNTLQFSPENKFTLTPSYTYGFGSGASLEFALDYSHESKIFDSENNSEGQSRPPTDFVDARAVFTSADNHWTFSVWGKNLTDEFTKTYDGEYSGTIVAAYNPPKTYGATLRWNY